jgi:multiple sugar transport system permease protein
MLFSLYLSFTRWDLLSPPQWIGTKNYIKMFTDDPLFWQSLKVTAKYAIWRVPAALAAALGIAMLMYQNVRCIKGFRTILYMPNVVAGVAVSVLWMWVFNKDFGIINTGLSYLHIQGPGWLSDPGWSLISMVIMSMWTVGAMSIIFLAGLKNIPGYLYGAAEIDGAGALTKFFRITLPQLTPTIFYNLIMCVIGAFQTFTEAYVMTNGGPMNSTLFYNFYLYNNAFRNFKMGYASAMAWFLFVIIIVCTLLVIRSSALWVYYEGERK